MSHLYAISGGGLKILAISVRACRRLQFDRMILRTQIVKETHDRSLFGGRFAVGLQYFLLGNGSDLVESFFDRVF